VVGVGGEGQGEYKFLFIFPDFIPAVIIYIRKEYMGLHNIKQNLKTWWNNFCL